MNHFSSGFKHFCLIFLVPVVMPLFSAAQKIVKVNLVSANSMEYKKQLGPDLRRLIGNVVFEHEGTNLYCDSAYFYEDKNSIDAFGNIRIRVSDTLNIYGNTLNYNGDTRVADLIGKVKLVDKETTLKTDHMIFDRNSGIASYHTGATITGTENNLKSRTGYYYTSTKQFFFKDSVVLTNPRYVMLSDTLLYQTVTRVSYFKGPTTITSKENLIYCENGWYNTVNDIAQFNKNAYLKNKGQTLKGDSLYYDRTTGLGKAFRNVSLFDSVQNILIKGNLGDYRKYQGYATVTDSVLGILIDRSDSLFLHADTLYATFDTTDQTKTMSAFHRVKFYRKDMQGLCDSLRYNLKDSTITLFRNPVLWSEDNQLTADSIRLWITQNRPDSMMLYNTAFIITRADSLKFNQIKGRNMTGYFKDKQLDRVKVNGNAKTIYFAREEDSTSIGVNIAAASDMLITLKDKKVQKIKYLSQPDAILYPEKDVSQKDILLPGFVLYEKQRPKNRLAIFTW